MHHNWCDLKVPHLVALAIVSWAVSTPALAADALWEKVAARQLAAEVLEVHPDMRLLKAEVASLEALIDAPGAWPNPMLGIEYSNMPVLAPWPGNHPMSGIQLKAEQVIPLWGKTNARQEVARKMAEVPKARAAEIRNAVTYQVSRLAIQLGLTRQLRQMTAGHIEKLGSMIGAVRIKYEQGAVEQHHLLRLQLLSDKLKESLRTFDAREQGLLSNLNILRKKKSDAPFKTPEVTPLVEARMPAMEKLLASAERQRGLFAALKKKGEVEDAKAERARREMAPDVRAWMGYRVRLPAPNGDAGANFITAGLAFPLPWLWNDARWGSQIRSAHAKKRAFDQEEKRILDQIAAALEKAGANLARHRAQALTYENELLPAADETLQATFTAYQVNRASFADLYSAEVQLIEFKSTVRMARAAAAQAALDIAFQVGAFSKSTPEGKKAP